MTRERRLTFGGVAELYDEARPSYPEALVDDLVELAAPSPRGSRVLELGAGTGKATVLFARRGIGVHALEPSTEMAAVARRNLAKFDHIRFEEVDFEDWDPGGATFALVFAAQAWHWISSEIGYRKARSVLPKKGILAAFWNRPHWEPSPLRAELDAAYRRAVPERGSEDPMHPAASSTTDFWDEWSELVQATPGLETLPTRHYEWARSYTTEEWLALLRTHSANIVLPDRQRAALLHEVGQALDEHGGRFELRYVTWLYLARAH